MRRIYSQFKQTKMEIEVQTDVETAMQYVIVSSKPNGFLKFIGHSFHARRSGYMPDKISRNCRQALKFQTA